MVLEERAPPILYVLVLSIPGLSNKDDRKRGNGGEGVRFLILMVHMVLGLYPDGGRLALTLFVQDFFNCLIFLSKSGD